VIVHWYSRPPELIDDFLDLGVYFTVGVEVLHSDLIREVAAKLPADRLLTETDNPGAWEWIAGEVGYPDLVGKVEEALATIKGVSRAELSVQVEQNFGQVLRAGGIDRK
jgi:TatD DNase family protein